MVALSHELVQSLADQDWDYFLSIHEIIVEGKSLGPALAFSRSLRYFYEQKGREPHFNIGYAWNFCRPASVEWHSVGPKNKPRPARAVEVA